MQQIRSPFPLAQSSPSTWEKKHSLTRSFPVASPTRSTRAIYAHYLLLSTGKSRLLELKEEWFRTLNTEHWKSAISAEVLESEDNTYSIEEEATSTLKVLLLWRELAREYSVTAAKLLTAPKETNKCDLCNRSLLAKLEHAYRHILSRPFNRVFKCDVEQCGIFFSLPTVSLNSQC